MGTSPAVRPIAVSWVVVFAWIGVAPSFAVTFTDTNFNNADWNSTKIVDTTPGNAASFTATQSTSGGNPGSFREVTHTYNSGNITVAHVNNAALYNPATQGPLSSVDFGYDIIRINPSLSAPLVGYAGLVVQNGSYYTTPVDSLGTATWTHLSHAALSPSDFSLAAGGGPATPDFSAGGASIRFGYITLNGASAGSGSTTTDSGIDNWTVSALSGGSTNGGSSTTAVPEPTTWLLVGSGLAGLAACRKRQPS